MILHCQEKGKLLLLSFSLLVCSCHFNDESTAKHPSAGEPSTHFRMIPSSDSGINFQNELNEGLNTNILVYEYFYNGGGVALGDFNGDQLVDIYFTSNMGDNKFYLNKGDLEFQDITQVSQATGRAGPWKTGVNAADVNGDGRLDLYICYSGALPPEKRKNQLYLNIGNDENNVPIFIESAEALGLASAAFSTQSYFVDYDHDHDLDMILLNHNPKNLPILNETRTRSLLKVDDPMRGIRIFNQQNGVFVDVTASTGVSSSELSYGLGVGIADLNNDQWPDFYVSNDYSVPDYLYINQQDGTFQNRLTSSVGHTSQFSMGNDVADLNNDGFQDILTLDMLPEDNKRQKLLLAPDDYSKFDLNIRSGFYYQYMRNMLQLNNGNGTFSEIGQFAGISNTDWSWSALLADFNNDGWKDLYVTNGYFRDYTNLDFINYMNDFVQQKGRLKRDDVLEIINQMPSSDISNYMYEGRGSSQFVNVTQGWSLDQNSNSNGAAYADLDNDGDLDLVVNNINKEAFIYENESTNQNDNHYLQIQLKGPGKNPFGMGSVIRAYVDDEIYTVEQFTARGYQSSVSNVIHMGLGTAAQVDSLAIAWPGGRIELLYAIQTNTRITLDYQDSQPREIQPDRQASPLFTVASPPIDYQHQKSIKRDFDRQPLLLSEISEDGPCLVKGDFDGNGLEDVIIGGESGNPAALHLQMPGGRFQVKLNTAFIEDRASEDCDALAVDVNNDGYLDLYVVSGGYHSFEPEADELKDRLYINDGTGIFNKSEQALPNLPHAGSCVAGSDINSDGFMDLFVGGRVIPGRFPESPGSTILINNKEGGFEDRTDELGPEIQDLGLVTDAVWIDVNRDNQEDLIIVGEWMSIRVFINNNGNLEDQTATYLEKPFDGLWNVIQAADLNADGQMDMIVGNMGTNTQIQASVEEPAELYFQDFDQNGSIDPILCFYIQGVSYPYLTRDELKRQLAELGAKYPSFVSYSEATIDDVFSKAQLTGAEHREVNTIETMILLSTPEGKYQKATLPFEVQYAPIHTISILDFNRDGNADVLMCGNDSKMKLRLGKSDANYGLLLEGDGMGSFKYIDQNSSGLSIRGDVRSVIQLDDLWLFGIKEMPLVAYKLKVEAEL